MPRSVSETCRACRSVVSENVRRVPRRRSWVSLPHGAAHPHHPVLLKQKAGATTEGSVPCLLPISKVSRGVGMRSTAACHAVVQRVEVQCSPEPIVTCVSSLGPFDTIYCELQIHAAPGFRCAMGLSRIRYNSQPIALDMQLLSGRRSRGMARGACAVVRWLRRTSIPMGH